MVLSVPLLGRTLLRWVLVRDPDEKMEPQAFFCTDTDMDPAEIISNFAKRWEMEVTTQVVNHGYFQMF